jgi:hypothetical protein
MSENSCCSQTYRTVGAYFVGVLGTFLIIGGLAYAVVRQAAPEVDAAAAANRAAIRAKVDTETKADANKWEIDPKAENHARLSVDRAAEILVGEWGKSSAEGRAKLLERLESSKKVASFE